MHHISEEAFDLGTIELKVYNVRNKRLGDSIFIQERKKDEYKDDIGSGLLIPLDRFNDFVKYLKKIGDAL